jgi:release factor glutamine methyltransferase
MNLTAFQSWKKNKINTRISIADWLDLAKNKRPDQSIEFNNSVLVILSTVLNEPKSWICAHHDLILEDDQKERLDSDLALLLSGVPLAYIVRQWSFFDLDFFIDNSVLIPRPETELLVQTALEWLKENHYSHSVADVGTGSGCISISLAKKIPDLEVTATDISWRALQLAKRNIEKHSISNIFLVQTNLLDCIAHQYDLICANLPYISTEDLKVLDVSKFEPLVALDGGFDGLQVINRLMRHSLLYLKKNGLLLLEFESSNSGKIEGFARHYFPGSDIQIINDLANKPRLLSVQTD